MSYAQSPGPMLVIRHTGQIFPLTQATITLGRQPDNTIVLADPQASRHHASISWEAGKYIIQDLGSANGTYVNERRVTAPLPLQHGFVIRVGSTIIDVRLVPVAESVARTMPESAAPQAHAPADESGRRSAFPLVLGLMLAAVVVVGTLFAAILLLLSGGRGKPTVTIRSPAQGEQVVVGNERLIQATASGVRDITRLELMVDDILVSIATSPDSGGMATLTASQPWTFGQIGEHVIAATAYTARGRTSDTVSISITVVDSVSQVTPTPTLTAPPPTIEPSPTPEPTVPPPTTPPPSVPPPDTPTPTPTYTFTPTPTATDTPTPTPTPTETPAPIVLFWVDEETITAGDSTFLRWHVEHVLEVYLDGVPVTGPDGQREVNPPVTTTYELRVIHAGGEDTRLVTIEVIAGELTVTRPGVAALDGFRANNGGGNDAVDIRVGNGMMVGSPSFELVTRGFMSFDLSGIPAGATVQAVELRFYQVQVTGDPYGKLGNLILKHVDYGPSLEDADYDGPELGSAILAMHPAPGEWYTITSSVIANWIEQDLIAGRTRLQMRLQFSTETDGDGLQDTVGFESGDNHFGSGNLPQLTITYLP
jgi:pSer/pThr/pTyr-binding forkhead associated (FHA) protein